MTPILKTPRGASYCAEALDALRYLRDDGQRFAMAWVDGPYFMGKGEWDPTLSLDAAVAWYAPYLEALTAVCAPSASVYLWGTDELEAELRRPMRALGWTFRRRVVWYKGEAAITAYHSRPSDWNRWPEATEVCGFYQREEWDPAAAKAALWRSGIHSSRIDAAMGVACMASRKWLGTDAQAQSPTGDDLMHVRSQVAGLGWPWTALEPRPAFNCPIGVSNVWTSPSVGGAERLRTPDGETHPCQKPLAFAERAVLASTRPGEAVLDLFAGTHRIAVAVERMKEARSWVAVEQDPRWTAIVRPHLQWDAAALAVGAQPSLFGGARG